MTDQHSTLPNDSRAQQDSEEAPTTTSPSAVDMLTLGLGMLEVAPLEDKTKQNEVRVFWDGFLEPIS